MKKTITVLSILILFFFLASTPFLPAQDAGTSLEVDGRGMNDALDNEMTPEIMKAIKKGLENLAKKQEQDGAWGGGPRIVATSQAALAFMSNGNTPGRGKYGKRVTKATKFILSKVDKTGFITESSRMYCHGFAALFLAEVYGTSQDETLNKEIKKKLKKATDLIARSQGSAGGWNYSPSKGNTDISVTICQAMALRAAKNAGIKIDSKCVENAIKGIKSAAVNNGMFAYQAPARGGGGTPACTGAGVCILQSFGQYDCKEVLDGLRYLEKQDPDRLSPYFYANYYYGLAMFQASKKHWKVWWPKMSKSLMKKQSRDGSWTGGGGGVNFSSGMALILLQLPYRYLPIVQT